jgi:hypothetical protein
VIDRGHGPDAEAKVEFLGFTATNDLVCRWISDSVRLFRVVENGVTLPQPVELSRPQVVPKRRGQDDAANG